MKTGEEKLSDKLDLFEMDGWKVLMEELEILESSVKDISTIQTEHDLWDAKGQLRAFNLILNLEFLTKQAMEELQQAKEESEEAPL